MDQISMLCNERALKISGEDRGEELHAFPSPDIQMNMLHILRQDHPEVVGSILVC